MVSGRDAGESQRASQGCEDPEFMNKNLLILVAALVVVGAVAGVAVPKMLSGTPAKAAKVVKKMKTVPLDEFLVNLADAGDPHYLKAVVALEVPEDPKLEEKLTEATPALRDAMITTMTKRGFHELLTPKGKADLKEALKTEANRVLGKETVEGVYFTSFAMQ